MAAGDKGAGDAGGGEVTEDMVGSICIAAFLIAVVLGLTYGVYKTGRWPWE